jgi:hypothetical protein
MLNGTPEAKNRKKCKHIVPILNELRKQALYWAF